MWDCAKNCGYHNPDLGGCTIDHDPETLFIMCPCFQIAVNARVSDTPTRAPTHKRAREPTGVNKRCEEPERTSCAHERGERSRSKEMT